MVALLAIFHFPRIFRSTDTVLVSYWFIRIKLSINKLPGLVMNELADATKNFHRTHKEFLLIQPDFGICSQIIPFYFLPNVSCQS